MSNVFEFQSQVRDQDLNEATIAAAVGEVAESLGADGVKAFFAGYIDPIETQKNAA